MKKKMQYVIMKKWFILFISIPGGTSSTKEGFVLGYYFNQIVKEFQPCLLNEIALHILLNSDFSKLCSFQYEWILWIIYCGNDF